MGNNAIAIFLLFDIWNSERGGKGASTESKMD